MSLLEGDLCGDWEDEDKGSGWDGDSRSGYSDSSGPFQSSQADRLGGPETGYASNIPHTSSTASASSTVSYFNLEPYSTRAGSGVCSISPQSPASREPSGSPSESSTDPILLQSASHSTLPVRQVWWATSDSDTVSGSERSNVLEEDGRAHTPETNTSEADLEDEDFSGPDEATTVSIPNDEEAFLGLEFPNEFRRPICSSLANIDSLPEAFELYPSPQANSNAAPWVPRADALARSPDPGMVALAPPPGPAYNSFYSPIRRQDSREPDEICKEGKALSASFRGQVTSTRNSKSNRHATFLAQFSGNGINSGHRPFQAGHNIFINLALPQEAPSPKLCRVIEVETDALIAQVSTFHPDFLISHLSATFVSALAVQICAPNSFIHTSEYLVDFSLGFGPYIRLEVSPFHPRDNKSLQSFQKRDGNRNLDVVNSLPIALNLFSRESTAEILNDWLDGIIDSPTELLLYANFMMNLHKRSLSAQVLQAVVSWFISSRKAELLEPERNTLRTVLKLLLSTSILILVPKITSLPPSLSDYLSQYSSYSSASSYSNIAPKLLTRQIKSSTYYLQEQLLRGLFSDLIDGNEMDSQVRLSVALIASFVLELVRSSGRDFAIYANKINQAVFVTEKQVKDYERSMESIIFDRIRSSVCGSLGSTDASTGEFGRLLKSLTSVLKGNGKDDDECRFVSAILTSVF